MCKMLATATAIIVLGLAATSASHARGVHRYYPGRSGYAGPVYGYQPQRPMTPQFNNPGSQIGVPQPGNAVDQLSPLMGVGQPDALGIK